MPWTLCPGCPSRVLLLSCPPLVVVSSSSFPPLLILLLSFSRPSLVLLSFSCPLVLFLSFFPRGSLLRRKNWPQSLATPLNLVFRVLSSSRPPAVAVLRPRWRNLSFSDPPGVLLNPAYPPVCKNRVSFYVLLEVRLSLGCTSKPCVCFVRLRRCLCFHHVAPVCFCKAAVIPPFDY